jgi:hypothetical protein
MITFSGPISATASSVASTDIGHRHEAQPTGKEMIQRHFLGRVERRA